MNHVRSLLFFFFIAFAPLVGAASARKINVEADQTMFQRAMVTVNLTFEVVDQDGFPLPSVSIYKNEELIGLSGIDGRSSTISVSPGDTLRFVYLGHATSRYVLDRTSKDISTPVRIVLTPAANQLSTVSVIGRRDELAREMPYFVETVSAREIELLQSNNSADALADLSGVYVQKSQFGGGSPVVRGFEANRVLLVVDGVRMNNAIYRTGHLQNAITVDVNALSRMELIYGPGSLAYGSDALGGVIHFRTRTPDFRQSQAGWKIGGQLGYVSAANGKRGGVQLEYGNTDFASYTQLSYNDFGDLRAGRQRPDRFPDFGKRPFYLERIAGRDSLLQNDDPNVQVGTAYRQLDVLQKFRFRLQDQLELKLNVQLSTSSNVPRYDNLSELSGGELRWAEWNYGPQNRLLASLRLDDRRGRSALFDLSSLILSQQVVEEDRITRRSGRSEREINEEDVYSSNLQWDFTKSFGPGRRLNYGFDARYDRVVSKASVFDVDRNIELVDPPIATRYPSGGSSLAAAGLYVDYKHELSARLTAQAGLRLNRQWLAATFGANNPVQWPQQYLDGIKNAAGAVTAAASLRYAHGGHRLRLLFAQGFRSPNVDDFAKFRENNGFIQVPNPELGSERSNSLELGYDREIDGWRIWATGYHTWLNNAIVRDAFSLPDGRDFFISFGDTLRVQANVNAKSARIYGMDFGVEKLFKSGLLLATDLHWLRGVRTERTAAGDLLNLPQDHIPPAYGAASLGYTNEKWTLRLRLRFQLAKAVEDYAVTSFTEREDGVELDREGSSDNLELTPRDPQSGAFTGTYAWSTWNFNLSRKISQKVSLHAGVENIFDVHYRTFASGVSAPGRNFLISLRLQ
jgi:hemoglobin/transferrin/lactoferrin receptor protein